MFSSTDLVTASVVYGRLEFPFSSQGMINIIFTLLRAMTLLLLSASASSSLPSSCDLQRARQWTPRGGYQGRGGLASANRQLNKHLLNHPHLASKPCERFATTEVRAVLRRLFASSSPELRAVYSDKDGRRARYASLSEMEAEWKRLDAVAGGDARVRDAHCHEAVMWFVHHITQEEQRRLRATLVLPLLPARDHTIQGERAMRDHAGRFYDSRVTCQDCHIGGLDDGPARPKHLPRTARERSRSCDTNLKRYGIDCGPCDGIDGVATGDDMRFFNQTACEVVAEPHLVPEAERVAAAFPEQFAVEVAGSGDHFGGRNASSPRIYSLSRGAMYGDIPRDGDRMLLRHETEFLHLYQDGVSVPLHGKARTAQVHVQTRKQRAEGVTGPQVFVSEGMPPWINSEWMPPQGCTCHVDVVGVPTLQHLQHLEYKGRIRLPELEFVGGSVVLDHWANWFFHIFMDTNRTSPHFGRAPTRISDSSPGLQKTGFSVYGEWRFGDPALRDPDIWRRDLPAGPPGCANPDRNAVCVNISRANFPPPAEAPACPFRAAW